MQATFPGRKANFVRKYIYIKTKERSKSMKLEKKDYLPVEVEIIAFNSQDIVTTSGGGDWWLGNDGNVDVGGWT